MPSCNLRRHNTLPF